MAMNYTPIPDDFLEEMEELSDAEYGRFIRSLQAYRMTGEMPELRGNERFYAKRGKMQIDRYVEHYEATAQQHREAGAKGGRPRKNQIEPNGFCENQTEPNESKKTYTKTKTNTETKTKTNTLTGDIRAGEPPKKFIPPTVEQVAEYVRARGSNVDPQHFVDFYASKGWMVGKSKMKDWKAACRNAENWECWNKTPQRNRNVWTAEDASDQEDTLAEMERLGLI